MAHARHNSGPSTNNAVAMVTSATARERSSMVSGSLSSQMRAPDGPFWVPLMAHGTTAARGGNEPVIDQTVAFCCSNVPPIFRPSFCALAATAALIE